MRCLRHVGHGATNFFDKGVETQRQSAEIITPVHRQALGQVALARGHVLQHLVDLVQRTHQRSAYTVGQQRPEHDRGQYHAPKQLIDLNHRFLGGNGGILHSRHDAALQLLG